VQYSLDNQEMPVRFVVGLADATDADNFRAMTVPIVFDRRLYGLRRLRAERTKRDNFLVRHAAENLSERLGAVKRRFGRALDLNARRESFALLAGRAETWMRTGLHPDAVNVSFVADEETLAVAVQSFDLIVSILGLHAVNDLPGALVQIRRALAPGGVFMAALFGGATLGEMRRAFASGESVATGGASPRVAPFADVRDMGALLQRAGFALPVADLDRLEVRYRTFSTLVDDLHALGETNSLVERRRNFLSRSVLAAALASYENDNSHDGQLTATFDILYLTGWAA
jgi:SAM-dependent methyltransferase